MFILKKEVNRAKNGLVEEKKGLNEENNFSFRYKNPFFFRSDHTLFLFNYPIPISNFPLQFHRSLKLLFLVNLRSNERL